MKNLLLIVVLFFSLQGAAQESYAGPENTKVEMADQFRSNGKIYVVVAVLSTILLGMILYTITLDRRLNKLENETKQ
jgi:hypothetical protein